MTTNSEIREKLEQDIAEVNWKDLRFHLQKDSIILVTEDLDLVDVAVDVVSDNKDQVALWIAAGKLSKPNSEQIDQWETQWDTPFRMLIAQPFILVQPVNHA